MYFFFSFLFALTTSIGYTPVSFNAINVSMHVSICKIIINKKRKSFGLIHSQGAGDLSARVLNLWLCTSLTCRYVAGKGLGSACRGVFSSLLAGGYEVHVPPHTMMSLMVRDTRMSGISNGTDTCCIFAG